MERAFLSVLLVCVVVRALASEYTVIQLALTIMVSHACSPCMISFYEYSIEEKNGFCVLMGLCLFLLTQLVTRFKYVIKHVLLVSHLYPQ